MTIRGKPGHLARAIREHAVVSGKEGHATGCVQVDREPAAWAEEEE